MNTVYLTFNGELRQHQTNDPVVDTLVRKGWQETTPPAYDSTKQKLSWDSGWVVSDLSAEEIAAAYEAANPPAKQFQVRIWLARNGINPETIPSLIEAQTADGPVRWEALERWRTVQDIPITHFMVGQLFAALKQAGGIPAEKTLEQVWQEILAVK